MSIENNQLVTTTSKNNRPPLGMEYFAGEKATIGPRNPDLQEPHTSKQSNSFVLQYLVVPAVEYTRYVARRLIKWNEERVSHSVIPVDTDGGRNTREDRLRAGGVITGRSKFNLVLYQYAVLEKGWEDDLCKVWQPSEFWDNSCSPTSNAAAVRSIVPTRVVRVHARNGRVAGWQSGTQKCETLGQLSSGETP